MQIDVDMSEESSALHINKVELKMVIILLKYIINSYWS